MRIPVVSDVHGDWLALQALIGQASFDTVISFGAANFAEAFRVGAKAFTNGRA